MKYDANEYFKRSLEEKKGIDNKLVNLYSIVLRSLLLKPTDIYYKDYDNSMNVLASFNQKENKGKNTEVTFIEIDKNNNLVIQLNCSLDNKRIQYNIGFDGNHYEISMKYNCDRQDDHDEYSGVYYINKNVSGLIKYKFFDYTSYRKITGYNMSDEKLYYNSNCFYVNGFDPDFKYELESNSQFSEEQLAIELNQIINNFSIEYSINFFEKLLNSYKPSEPEMNYILK